MLHFGDQSTASLPLIERKKTTKESRQSKGGEGAILPLPIDLSPKVIIILFSLCGNDLLHTIGVQ
jgi:hypothetical protein